jgi:uncharacterized protein YjbI with pentapeptide repeats
MKHRVPLFNDEEKQEAWKRITKYISNFSVDKDSWKDNLINGLMTKIEEPIIGESFKRSYGVNGCFENTKVKFNSFTGSNFKNIIFKDCEVEGNSFLSCNMVSSKFYCSKEKGLLKSNNMSQSFFNFCSFENMLISSSTISQSVFNNTSFNHVSFEATTFENTIFNNCVLTNVSFGTTNIDYITLRNTVMKNVSLPLYQLLYTIGGMSEIFNEENENVSLAYKLNGKIKQLSLQQFLEMLPDFAKVCELKNEFFPLCNILIFLNKKEAAINVLNVGIEKAMEVNDFRSIKYYCRLSKYANILDSKKATNILNIINEKLLKEEFEKSTLNIYLSHYGEIRDLLYNKTENSNVLEFNLKTKILENDHENINSLMNALNIIISSSNFPDGNGYIDIRHNSPYEILVKCMGEIPNILAILANIVTIVQGFSLFKQLLKNNKYNNQEEILNSFLLQHSSIEKHSNPKEIIDSKIETQCEALKSQLKRVKKSEMDKYIDSFYHTIQNITGEYLDKEIVIFKSKDS